MTVEELIENAKLNRTGDMSADAFSPPVIDGFLRAALSALLADIDYEANKKSGAAIAARILATIISGADELVPEKTAH